ncbi:MAG: FKBP-type peptidyl-prolyl cis-trans isomerase [Defluviitaleaceae bacterium]|nr:FKBP-type peptidyl-prolyl cis-trans isomerase [Defluviitaleaceae bacterium]
MKNLKLFLCISAILAMTLAAATGCGSNGSNPSASPSPTMSTSDAATTQATDSADASQPTDASPTATGSSTVYSNGIGDDGFLIGIKATDYIDMFAYKGMQIPTDSYTVTDTDLQNEIDNMLSQFATTSQVTDRAVADGDTVNIDYVGSIDGVAFDGGSTNGQGTNVTLGTTQYIPGFLDQLVGHTPGETFDINVTFPTDYSQADLAGKAAVFNTTINYISVSTNPDLTDDFVATNLSSYGWTTIDQMKAGMTEQLKQNKIEQYIDNYFTTNVTIKSIPDSLTQYEQDTMMAYFQHYADQYGLSLDDFISQQEGYSSEADLITAYADTNKTNAEYVLVSQAVAEDAGITVSTTDVSDYFAQHYGSSDYSSYQSQYGLPYIMQVVLHQKVLDFVASNAVLQ